MTARLNCIVCLREREQERCRRLGCDQDDDKTDDDGGNGGRFFGVLASIHYTHTHTHTKSNHVSLFSSFLAAADAAAAAVTVRPYVIR